MPGDARSRPAGRGRAPGGLSAPALAIQGAPLPRPCPRCAHPGPPGLRDFQRSSTGLAPTRAPPFPGRSPSHAAVPPPLLHFQKAPEKPPRARGAPSASPDRPPSRSAQDGRYFPSSLRRTKVAHPLRVATHLGSGQALRCLRLRRALTSDSRCVRRPHKPRELPPPRAPRPRPRAGHAPFAPGLALGLGPTARRGRGRLRRSPALLLAGAS